MDARAPGAQRWSGRDLSGHDERDFCAGGAGPFAGRSAHRAGNQEFSSDLRSKKATPSALRPAFRPCGTRRLPWWLWKKRDCRRIIRHWSKPPDGCCEKQICGSGRLDAQELRSEPGGWAFEFRNDFYPDVDDTAFVLMALAARGLSGQGAHGSGRFARDSPGCWRCRTTTAAGARSTTTTIANSCAIFRSPITTR